MMVACNFNCFVAVNFVYLSIIGAHPPRAPIHAKDSLAPGLIVAVSRDVQLLGLASQATRLSHITGLS